MPWADRAAVAPLAGAAPECFVILGHTQGAGEEEEAAPIPPSVLTHPQLLLWVLPEL